MSKLSAVEDKKNTNLDRSEEALLEHLSDRIRKDGLRFLQHFPQPLEQGFRAHFHRQSMLRLRMVLLGLIGVCILTGLIDYWIQPSYADGLWELRVPILAIWGMLLAGSFIGDLNKFHSLAGLVAIINLTIFGITCASASDTSLSFVYFAFIPMLVLFSITFSQLLFSWSAFAMGAMLLVANGYALFAGEYGWQQVMGFNVALIITGVLGLLTVYVSESARRDLYLQIQHNHIVQIDPKELDENRGRLRFLVALDALTGIANKKSFDRALKLEWDRAARQKHSISLIMVDIDHFKEFNKQHGRKTGDLWLQKIAVETKRFARRPGDIAARYTDDSFVIMLAETEAANANQVAESLLKNIEGINQEMKRSTVPNDVPQATVSIGIATMVPSPKLFPADIVSNSIYALNQARKMGAGRVYNLAAS